MSPTKTGEIPGVNLYDLLDGKDVKYSARDQHTGVTAAEFPADLDPAADSLCGNRTAHGTFVDETDGVADLATQ